MDVILVLGASVYVRPYMYVWTLDPCCFVQVHDSYTCCFVQVFRVVHDPFTLVCLVQVIRVVLTLAALFKWLRLFASLNTCCFVSSG